MINLLKDIGKVGDKPVATPMDANQKLGDAKNQRLIDRCTIDLQESSSI